jgi:hypothetical protein
VRALSQVAFSQKEDATFFIKKLPLTIFHEMIKNILKQVLIVLNSFLKIHKK